MIFGATPILVTHQYDLSHRGLPSWENQTGMYAGQQPTNALRYLFKSVQYMYGTCHEHFLKFSQFRQLIGALA